MILGEIQGRYSSLNAALELLPKSHVFFKRWFKDEFK